MKVIYLPTSPMKELYRIKSKRSSYKEALKKVHKKSEDRNENFLNGVGLEDERNRLLSKEFKEFAAKFGFPDNIKHLLICSENMIEVYNRAKNFIFCCRGIRERGKMMEIPGCKKEINRFLSNAKYWTGLSAIIAPESLKPKMDKEMDFYNNGGIIYD